MAYNTTTDMVLQKLSEVIPLVRKYSLQVPSVNHRMTVASYVAADASWTPLKDFQKHLSTTMDSTHFVLQHSAAPFAYETAMHKNVATHSDVAMVVDVMNVVQLARSNYLRCATVIPHAEQETAANA